MLIDLRLPRSIRVTLNWGIVIVSKARAYLDRAFAAVKGADWRVGRLTV
ncbi:hypothetical protein ACE1ET_02510 [Saccharicrinis sp. FJH62]